MRITCNISVISALMTLACIGCKPASEGPLAVTAVATPAPIQVLGRAYYVAPHGNRQANGLTPETPLPAQRAEELSKPGDVIFFTEGEYIFEAGSRALTIEHSGEAGKPIIYTPAPGAKVTLRNNGAWEVVKVIGASYIEIRGFRVVGDAQNVTQEEAMAEMSNPKNPRTCAAPGGRAGLFRYDTRLKQT